jgi:Fe-S-cluster-containing dehydrogenase component
MMGAGFLVDLHRCVGCGACVLACRIENGRDSDLSWRRVLPLNLRRHPGGPAYSLSVACHHCERPACLLGCPSRAYHKRADGVVLHDADRCLGCRYCEMTCPFSAPKYDEQRGVVSKCHLCSHRLDGGEPPACIVACPTEALQYVAAKASHASDARAAVPGFVDPAGCGPNIRFAPPKGTIRAALFVALEEALRR